MRWSVVLGSAGLALLASVAPGRAQSHDHHERLNRMIPLLEQGLPILGVAHPPYAAGRRRGDGQSDGEPMAQPDIAEAATETVSYTLGDYVLNSYSPETADRYREFMRAIVAAGGSAHTHPFVAKVPIVHDNEDEAIGRMIDQLNDGQVVVVMQEVETVAEVERAIAAMRFTSKGGTRPESGFERAAAYWGLSAAEYRERADVWPLNPNGELLLNVIIESKEGVANAEAIAAVPGVAVVTVGAGTLGGVFSSTNAAGERVRDQAGFDQAVAKILAACKAAEKSCGYPANNPEQVEALMADGWDFLIMQRRDQDAFDAVVTGRKLGGRPMTP